MREMAQPASTEDRIAKQTEYTKKMIDKGLNHGREIAMMATKTGTEAAEVLQKRTTEGIDELQGFRLQIRRLSIRTIAPIGVRKGRCRSRRRPFSFAVLLRSLDDRSPTRPSLRSISASARSLSPRISPRRASQPTS